VEGVAKGGQLLANQGQEWMGILTHEQESWFSKCKYRKWVTEGVASEKERVIKSKGLR
jgi:hypothetical protein